MKIHHSTIPAHNPEHVAAVLAEILGGRVIEMPHPHGSLLVYAGDTDGTAIEVWHAKLRAPVEGPELVLRDLPLPEAWPHHSYVSTDASDADRILAIFAREGWRAELSQNGPPGLGFSLVRGHIENHAAIEIASKEMRQQYERFFAQVVNGARAA